MIIFFLLFILLLILFLIIISNNNYKEVVKKEVVNNNNSYFKYGDEENLKDEIVGYENDMTKRELSILEDWKSDKLAMLEEIDKWISKHKGSTLSRYNIRELKQSLGGGQ
jgi:predicted Holliday junction resolvase-like endonuclease